MCDTEQNMWPDTVLTSSLFFKSGGVPAKEEGHVEEWGEESEELEGEHLHCEASLCGSKGVCLLWTFKHTGRRRRE